MFCFKFQLSSNLFRPNLRWKVFETLYETGTFYVTLMTPIHTCLTIRTSKARDTVTHIFVNAIMACSVVLTWMA